MKSTKIIVAIALLISFAFVTAIFVSLINSYEKSEVNPTKNLISDTNLSSGIQLILDLTEISKHNQVNDCWLLINNKIYDVTSFISIHPGNAQTIIKNCGKDSTQEYSSRGGTGSHSSTALNLLDSYYIGNLGDKMGKEELQNKTSFVQNITSKNIGEIEDEDEEDEEED